MIETVLIFGLLIFAGFGLILIKLPTRAKLWVLSHPILVDVSITVFTLIIHWGTMTGLMAAAVAGLTCSLATSFGRWSAGYWKDGWYIRGKIWRLE